MDVILGMDRLSRYGVKMDCSERTITLISSEVEALVFQGYLSMAH